MSFKEGSNGNQVSAYRTSASSGQTEVVSVLFQEEGRQPITYGLSNTPVLKWKEPGEKLQSISKQIFLRSLHSEVRIVGPSKFVLSYTRCLQRIGRLARLQHDGLARRIENSQRPILARLLHFEFSHKCSIQEVVDSALVSIQ